MGSLRYLKVDETRTRRVYYLVQVEYNSRGRKVRRQYIGSEPLVHAPIAPGLGIHGSRSRVRAPVAPGLGIHGSHSRPQGLVTA